MPVIRRGGVWAPPGPRVAGVAPGVFAATPPPSSRVLGLASTFVVMPVHGQAQVTINTTAAAEILAGHGQSAYGTSPVLVRNNNNGTTNTAVLFVGGPSVTTGTGFPLSPGDTYIYEAEDGDLYGCCLSGSTVDVRVLTGGN